MIKRRKNIFVLPSFGLALALTMGSCSMKSSAEKPAVTDAESANLEAVAFNADSAYNYIERQVNFGKRVPGTPSHDECAEWLTTKLAEFSDTVEVQEGTVTAFNGDRLPVKNIFGRINPSASDRVLLLAHYDSRPWADGEPDAAKREQPIDGANDGASGVGVILEIARVLKANNFQGGVDYLFVDAEDYGVPSHLDTDGKSEDSWCLGTQFWTRGMPYTPNNRPRFAILLDMVGGYGARFHREYFSEMYASPINDLVWATANRLGYGASFVNELGNPITDDHIYLLKASISTIDIIENKNPQTGSFNPTWHTLDDNISNIDKSTLKAVGETVSHVVMNK